MADIALAVTEARTQTVLVMIQMARQALFGFNRPIIAHISFRTFHMTFFTLVLGMGADQGIACFLLMIEGFGRLPFFGRVAKAAFLLLELAFVIMHIIFHMALVTGTHETGIADFTDACGLVRALRSMALGTINFYVGPVQIEPCFAVIEGFGIDIHGVKITTLMILMTVDTGFIIHQTMIVLTRVDILANFLVAREAVVIGYPTRRLVTLQTIVMRVFQLIVTQEQRPRCQQLVEETFKFQLGIRALAKGRRRR